MPTPLRFYRRMHDMTQAKLAETLGVSQTLIHRYEKGQLPIPENLIPKIAQALGIHERLLAPDSLEKGEPTHATS